MRAITLALILLPTSLFAAESVDQQQSWQAGTPIVIEVPRGELTLTGSDSSSVRVSGTLDEQTKQFVFEQQSDQLLIKVELPKSWGNGQNNNQQHSDLTIDLPAAAEVSVAVVSTDISSKALNNLAIDAVSGDIELADGSGSFKINTVSGNLTASALEGSINIQTVSGDIDAEDNSGDLRLSSVSGDIEAENLNGDIELESVSGDIELSSKTLEQLKGRVVSGDLNISSNAIASQGKLSLESVSGDLSIAIAELGEVTVNAQTGGGGSISNKWSNTHPLKSKYGGGSSLQFGGSGTKVDLSTVSGDIDLKLR